MKYLAIFLLIGGLSTGEGLAQDYLFRVLANKGSNQIKKDGSTVSVLKTGAKLYPGDQIIAQDGAYIGLVHKSGKTVEVRSSGVHNVDQLANDVSKTSSSLTSRYMNFVMSKMNEEDGNVNKNYRSNLHATGAVSRAAGKDLALLMMDPGSPNKVYSDKVIVRWEGGEANETFKVTLKDIFSDVVYEAESNENKIELDFKSEQLKAYNYLLIAVESTTSNKVSEEYGIHKLDPSETNLSASLQELEAQLTDGSSMNNLVYASFFEDKNLYLDAMTKYDAAATENPDVEDFQTIYNQFIGIDEMGGE